MSERRQLYRDTDNARIAGVCAGIANYFGIERWLVRILFVTSFCLLAPPFIFVAYIACWFIFDKKPNSVVSAPMDNILHHGGKGWRNRVSDADKVSVKTKVWQAGEPPKQAFFDISKRFAESEARLRRMEKYVTSKEFQLNREISRL